MAVVLAVAEASMYGSSPARLVPSTELNVGTLVTKVGTPGAARNGERFSSLLHNAHLRILTLGADCNRCVASCRGVGRVPIGIHLRGV